MKSGKGDTDGSFHRIKGKHEHLQTLQEKPVSQVPTSLPLLDLEKALSGLTEKLPSAPVPSLCHLSPEL